MNTSIPEVRNLIEQTRKNLERIVVYCEKDVVAMARVYLKMKCIEKPVIVFEQQKPIAVEQAVLKEVEELESKEDKTENE